MSGCNGNTCTCADIDKDKRIEELTEEVEIYKKHITEINVKVKELKQMIIDFIKAPSSPYPIDIELKTIDHT